METFTSKSAFQRVLGKKCSKFLKNVNISRQNDVCVSSFAEIRNIYIYMHMTIAPCANVQADWTKFKTPPIQVND